MKKWIAMLLAVLTAVSLTACAAKSGGQDGSFTGSFHSWQRTAFKNPVPYPLPRQASSTSNP